MLRQQEDALKVREAAIARKEENWGKLDACAAKLAEKQKDFEVERSRTQEALNARESINKSLKENLDLLEAGCKNQVTILSKGLADCLGKIVSKQTEDWEKHQSAKDERLQYLVTKREELAIKVSALQKRAAEAVKVQILPLLLQKQSRTFLHRRPMLPWTS